METCSKSDKSVCLELSSFTVGGSSIDDRGDTLHESLLIQDAKNSTKFGTSTLVEDCTRNTEEIVAAALEVHENGKIESSSMEAPKCLSKSITFPPSGKISSLSTSSEEEKSGSAYLEKSCKECSNATYLRSMSLPNPLKLVPAIKGSREKQGMDPKKLTVTWAPDVYDPLPTSTSHVKKNGGQQRSKSWKNKHKGKTASRGSSSKDKKHLRKTSGSSDICYKALHAQYRLICRPFTDHDGVVDFAVDSRDSNCGSSYLKKSLDNAQLPVAEAI